MAMAVFPPSSTNGYHIPAGESDDVEEQSTSCNGVLFENGIEDSQFYNHFRETDRVHSCEFCGKAFRKTTHLQRHRLIHTAVRRFKCDTCGKDFYRRDKYNDHVKMHLRKFCTECDAIFDRKGELQRHLEQTGHVVDGAIRDEKLRAALRQYADADGDGTGQEHDNNTNSSNDDAATPDNTTPLDVSLDELARLAAANNAVPLSMLALRPDIPMVRQPPPRPHKRKPAAPQRHVALPAPGVNNPDPLPTSAASPEPVETEPAEPVMKQPCGPCTTCVARAESLRATIAQLQAQLDSLQNGCQCVLPTGGSNRDILLSELKY